MRRGQVTIETIIGISVVLMLFAIIAVNNAQKASMKEIVEGSLEESRKCRNLAQTITLIYSQGSGSVSELSIDFDANILSNIVFLENTSCTALGSVQDAELSKGTVIVKNLSGTVVLENA